MLCRGERIEVARQAFYLCPVIAEVALTSGQITTFATAVIAALQPLHERDIQEARRELIEQMIKDLNEDGTVNIGYVPLERRLRSYVDGGKRDTGWTHADYGFPDFKRGAPNVFGEYVSPIIEAEQEPPR